jgi:transposase
MPATHDQDRTTPAPAPLYLAFELGWTSWGLAFSTAPALPPRRVTIPARDLRSLGREIDRARHRFGLPDTAPVRSCYEAGRDGFWLHRSLASRGIDDAIVDSSSIEVNRRARRAKSDAIDVTKLLGLLLRYHNGERDVWSVVNVPAPEDIVALARKLLIALWKYLEHGEVPEGATQVPWEKELNGRLPAASRPA